MNKEQRSKIAFSLTEEIKDNEYKRRVLLAQNARNLSEILSQKYYKEILGDENGEWAGFLSDIEIYYSRNKIQTYIRLYDKLSKVLNILPEDWVHLPITRISDCLTFLTKENYEEWFSKAGTLLSSDWKKELDLSKGKEIDKEHNHKMVKYEICSVCGEKHKI